MSIIVEKTDLQQVLLITPPTVFNDNRGHYIELYNHKLYNDAGIGINFVQDDISVSGRDVLRGLHGDSETWKLISCPLGQIYLVVVDNQPSSAQYKHWQSFTLSEQSPRQVLVPPNHGLGHLVMSERACFSYKQSSYYNREKQFTLAWNDPALGISWPVHTPILSERDSSAKFI